MWALRRVSLPLRNGQHNIRGFTAAFPDLEQPTQVQNGVLESPEVDSNSNKCPCFKGFYCRKHASSNPFLGRRSFSSQAVTNGSGAEEVEDDSKVESSSLEEEEDALSEHEYDHDESSKNEVEIDDADLAEEVPSKNTATQSLVNAMIVTKGRTIKEVLTKWVEEGNALGPPEINGAKSTLSKLKMYWRALQFSEWLQESKRIEFAEKDYSSHLNLVAKVHGLHAAESYIEKIPEPFRGELVYRTLLANCVQANNVKKAEQVFNKMRDLEFPVTVFACNQLLLLYKRIDKKKMADILLLMERENLKPSFFTYNILLDTKGKFNDIEGMEAISETMKKEGIDHNMNTRAIMAGHYISAGLKEKAEALLQEMEGGNLKENRHLCMKLLDLYARLGQAEEVRRVWKVCETNPVSQEWIAAIRAWGRLKEIEEAEAVFEKMMARVKRPASPHFNSLLMVYADNKMLDKGKDLAKRMVDSGCSVGALAWDSLVKLFLQAGELGKAEAVLKKASERRLQQPILFRSYMAIMDQYSKKGDVHNTEKIFLKMRQAGYQARYNQFASLLQAYINAKRPAYGIRERMKADNIFPNKAMAAQLAKVNGFWKMDELGFLD